MRLLILIFLLLTSCSPSGWYHVGYTFTYDDVHVRHMVNGDSVRILTWDRRLDRNRTKLISDTTYFIRYGKN